MRDADKLEKLQAFSKTASEYQNLFQQINASNY